MTRVRQNKTRVSRNPKPLSDEDILRFLRNLASIYRDKKTGNPPLSDALLRVIERLGNKTERDHEDKGPTPGRTEYPELALQAQPVPFDKMTPDDMNRFIVDGSRTKAQLIDFASSRFGIPRASLQKLTVDAVREAVRSAMMHEASLTVIGEEAARYGTRRQS